MDSVYFFLIKGGFFSLFFLVKGGFIGVDNHVLI